MNKISSSMISCLCFIALTVSSFADQPPEDQERSSFSSLGITKSRIRDWDNLWLGNEDDLKSSLLDLRENVQELRGTNRSLLEKVKRFEARIPQLQQEFQNIKEGEGTLHERKQQIRETLIHEKAETESARAEFSRLAEDVERLNTKDSEIYEKISQKHARQKDLQREADQLLGEISQLQDRLSADERPRRDYQDEKAIKLNQLYEDKIQHLSKRKKELSHIQEILVRSHQERDALLEQGQGLEGELTEHNQELNSMEDSWRGFDLQDNSQEGKIRLEQLSADVAQLSQRHDQLLSLVEEQRQLQVNLISRFDEQKKEFLDTIQSLQTENQRLQNQQKLLEEVWQRGQKVLGREGGVAAVEALNQQIADLKEEGAQLNIQISQKNEEMAAAQKTYAELKKEISQLKKNIEADKEKTERMSRSAVSKYNQLIVERQQKLKRTNDEIVLVKNPVWGQKEIKRLELEKEKLDKQLTMAQADLQSAVQTEMKLTPEPHTAEDIVQLNMGIKHLKANAQGQEEVLRTVRKNLVRNGMSPKKFQAEKRQLKKNLNVLQEESQHLQTEILSLTVKQDRLRKP